jgi:hypothetical protein
MGDFLKTCYNMYVKKDISSHTNLRFAMFYCKNVWYRVDIARQERRRVSQATVFRCSLPMRNVKKVFCSCRRNIT